MGEPQKCSNSKEVRFSLCMLGNHLIANYLAFPEIIPVITVDHRFLLDFPLFK